MTIIDLHRSVPSAAKLNNLANWNTETQAPSVGADLHGSRYRAGVAATGGGWLAWGRVGHIPEVGMVDRFNEIHGDKAAAMAAVERWLTAVLVQRAS